MNMTGTLSSAVAATTHGNTLQNTATHGNTLQRNATHCNTLQHTATADEYDGRIIKRRRCNNTP